MEDSADQRLLDEFESRIKKTESDKKVERVEEGPPKQLLEWKYEEGREESNEHQIYCPENDQFEEIFRKNFEKPESPQSFKKSETDENDYNIENILIIANTKAKKYKKKAKKLYSNLQKLKFHYEKAKRNVSELEYENQTLNDQLQIYSERIHPIQNSYNN